MGGDPKLKSYRRNDGGFQAPEVDFKKIYTKKSDTFALGVLIYIIIARQLPWQSLQSYEDCKPYMIGYNENPYACQMQQILCQCMSANPSNRPLLSFLRNDVAVNLISVYCEEENELSDSRAVCIVESPEFDINHKEQQHATTALHKACQDGRDILVTAILAVDKLDLTALDKDGSTAMHLAAASGKTTSCELLFEAGVSLDIANNDGETALDLAIEYDEEETAQFLRQAGGHSKVQSFPNEWL